LANVQGKTRQVPGLFVSLGGRFLLGLFFSLCLCLVEGKESAEEKGDHTGHGKATANDDPVVGAKENPRNDILRNMWDSNRFCLETFSGE